MKRNFKMSELNIVFRQYCIDSTVQFLCGHSEEII